MRWEEKKKERRERKGKMFFSFPFALFERFGKKRKHNERKGTEKKQGKLNQNQIANWSPSFHIVRHLYGMGRDGKGMGREGLWKERKGYKN